jgi:hypothetical protein
MTGETNTAFEEIVKVIKTHRRDGYEVPAVRIPPDTYKELACSPSFIASDGSEKFPHEESIGMAASTEIIVDDSISAPVADDVKLRDDVEV